MNTPIDVLVRGGRVIDPARGRDGVADLAISNGRVVAMDATQAAMPARRVIDASGAIVCPGFIDLHVHVYEWVTNFGLPADHAGWRSGATTIVDQGSAGAWTVGGFKAYVADPARTDVRCFISINLAGALQGGMRADILHNPNMVDFEGLLEVAARHPRLVRGIKCHGESGGLSHWGTQVLGRAAEAGRAASLPLYVHTGELFPVDEANRPHPSRVMGQVVPFLKPGDVLAHVYSCMPDGIMGPDEAVPGWIAEAKAEGVLFDLGRGVNFSYRIARKMMQAGIFPDTLGSDVHGDFNATHDFSRLDYSLLGGFNTLLALGMPLVEAIRGLTATPAAVLGDPTIGHLGAGARANISVLRQQPGKHLFRDAAGETLLVRDRWMPDLLILDGEVLTPDFPLRAEV
jgi:dihydroorotase